jgi:hypothetical protein
MDMNIVYVWEHKVQGKVIGEIRRYKNGDGKKADYPYYKIGKDGFELGRPKKKPYPLIGLDSITDTEKPVIVCEGQKKQLIWESLGYQCITSLFGCGSAEHSTWDACANISTFWLAPDNDAAGTTYAKTVWSILKKISHCNIYLLKLPGIPKKGDLCDWLKGLPESKDWEEYIPFASTFPGIASIKAKLSDAISSGLSDIPDDWELTEEWTEPYDLTNPIRPVVRLVPSMIPEPLRDWAVDIQKRMGCPLEYVAVGALCMVAGAIGSAVGVRPKERTDWTIYGNLWGLICGPPASYKSPALKDAVAPLQEQDKEAAKVFSALDKQYQKELAVYRERIKPPKNSRYTQPDYDAMAIDEPTEPPRRRFIVNDTTIEALQVLLQFNPRGLLCYVDEITQLINTWEKENKQGDRGFYISAWEGGGSYVVDRISRKETRIPVLSLSILGSIQPDKLNTTLVRTLDTDNDGLLQRFQAAIYLTAQELAQDENAVDTYPDSTHRKMVFDLIQTITNTSDFQYYGATLEKDDVSAIPYFKLDKDGAQQEFIKWLNKNNEKLKDEENPYLVQHFSKYRKLCPTLILIFHVLNVCADGNPCAQIPLETVQLAAAWCALFEQHATRIYNAAAPTELLGAHSLGKQLLANKLPNPFALRDVQRKNWRFLAESAKILQALKVLEEYNWVRQIVPPVGPNGGRKKIEYWINPKLGITDG